VPLSEHEQRLLEQIERALYADDPKFATAVRATDLRRHFRRRVFRGVVVFVVGIVVLLSGTVAQVIVLGVAGFVVMLTGALMAVHGYKRLGGASPEPPARARVRSPKAARPRVSLFGRLEERWRRRRDERDW
jgi:hypothetical protein